MKTRLLLSLAIWAMISAAVASDPEAHKFYDAGYKLYQSGDYYEAGKKFEDAELEADDPLIRKGRTE